MAINNNLKVIVSGAGGNMGRRICRAILETENLELSGGADPYFAGQDAAQLAGFSNRKATIFPDLKTAIQETAPGAIVDFTSPHVVMGNIETALSQKIPVVVGTTGLTESDIDKIKQLTNDNNTSAFVAPNFAIGAVLMMEFAAKAAKYLPHVEIIELHHNGKIDAPSGTSMRTADLIAAARAELPPSRVQEVEQISGARGCSYQNIHIHSVRLPGLIAHQEVLFGGDGQTLTIRHDSLDRSSFMPGIILALNKIRSLDGLVIGLENLL